MAEESHTAPLGAEQPTKIRLMSCLRCGEPCARLNNGQKFCAACRPLEKKLRDRECALRNRQKRRRLQVAWDAANVDKVRACKRRYRLANPEKVRSSKLAWQAAHPEKSRASCRRLYYRDVERSRERARHRAARNLRESASFKLNAYISTAIGSSLKGSKGGRRWQSLVGYTLSDLANHIEKQFSSGMTWDNRGTGPGRWHIDHIVPKSTFHFDSAECPEFRACWALSNLRPFWSQDNLSKSSKRTHLL